MRNVRSREFNREGSHVWLSGESGGTCRRKGSKKKRACRGLRQRCKRAFFVEPRQGRTVHGEVVRPLGIGA